ncbi:hypothetical protein PVAP13_8NG254901 [Panicum virgatum]|uniref:Uncharacterized protein n=1 Tax=Panicum virgatum TaxID=38727 RepID=A0A8T0PB84_PANVG|nr:hypothetical protein PVAP13_8NG254901 [Panicum virgatum]
MASNKHAGEGSSSAPLPLRPRHRDNDADLPANIHALDEGTQGLIRDLLRQSDEACRQLDAAQTDRVVIRG